MEPKRSLIRTPEKTAFTIAIFGGVVIHSYALVNIIHNYDNIAMSLGGFGGGIPLGRWFLDLLNTVFYRLQMDYNLPVFNGLLLILLVALAARFAVSALQVQHCRSAAGIGLLFVVFPSITATMFFRFTAHLYGFAILLAVVAVWVLPQKGGFILSSLLVSLSLGIYQAYIPLTITLFVIQLIQMSLQEDADFWHIVRQGIYRCAALISGTILYFLFLRFFLMISQKELSSYQSTQNIGKLSLSAIPGLIKRTYWEFCMMPLYDYCGLAHTSLLKALYWAMALISGIMIFYMLFKRKKPINILMTGILCAIFPLAVNFIVIMAPEADIYTLMVYSFVLIPCIPLILWEQIPEASPRIIKSFTKKAVAIITAATIFLYGYYANVHYTAQESATRQMGHYANSILTQARMTPGFTAEKKWVFIGNNEDPMRLYLWNSALAYGGSAPPYGGNPITDLMTAYSIDAWFWGYLGYEYPTATPEEEAFLIPSEKVQSMPCWPDYGSMQVIEDYLVIKFQEHPQ